jgi:hypothetical protein
MATFCQAVEPYYDSRDFEGGETLTWDHEGGMQEVTGRGYPCSDMRSVKDGGSVVQSPCVSMKVCHELRVITWICWILPTKQQSDALWSRYVELWEGLQGHGWAWPVDQVRSP